MTVVEASDLASAMPKKSADAITKLFHEGPTGSFLKGKHGFTHYMFESPDATASTVDRKIVVMCHGIGTNLHVYDDLSKACVSVGYTVLRYEYYNHGFSVGFDRNLKITKDVMLDQLEELLDHVVPYRSEPIYGFVGHSTGGTVGVVAANSERLRNRKIVRLALVSPCLWAAKPITAQIGDKVPAVVDFALRVHGPIMELSVKDAYIANTHLAFAKDPRTKKYRYPEVYKRCLAFNKAMFKHHPYVTGGVGGINCYFLAGDLLPKWRDELKAISTRAEDPVETKLIWGTDDVVVDYKSQHLTELGGLDRVEIVPIERQGHESLYENTEPIAKVVLEFFSK